ncbi:16S rRNA (cytosine(967)-C(5))-methyltransferase RsmB [bacterium]|nr:16S rRNA (cytosine(967)-C(5))-methyltransferase RsmB [bacterium]MBU1983854.1 16S rRNA (cytosine(967)-C(5))-methyltransferase RsmB [bacterium]
MTDPVPVTSRGVAADALAELERDPQFADEIIARHLTQSNLRGSDRALAADLFWGSIRWRGRLDSVVSPVFHGDYFRAQPLIRVLLRMGGYQLFCQDRVPDHAAVSQTVEVAVQRMNKSAAGLINAVLRRLARERERWSVVPEGTDELGRLAFLHSHPRWIVRELAARFGQEELPRVLAANNERAPLTVCTNPLRWKEADFEEFLRSRAIRFEPSVLIDGYYRFPSPAIFQLQHLLDDGSLTVHDESAGLAVELLSPEPGERILDLCAAPGGKLLGIYQHVRGEADLVAIEISPERTQKLSENLQRIGAAGVAVHTMDAREFSAEPFDRVLADVPCSGLGLLRKHSDVRWRRKSHHLALQRKLQLEILSRAAELVRPNGVLVYSTCSILPSENHEIVTSFLKAFPEFHKEDARGFTPESTVGEHGDLEVFTHIHGCDGAFAARFRRTTTA